MQDRRNNNDTDALPQSRDLCKQFTDTHVTLLNLVNFNTRIAGTAANGECGCRE
jgi:hypothetical protein